MIDAAVGGSSTTVGVVGGVAGAAHQATVTTVDQTQIITLQVCAVLTSWLHQVISPLIPFCGKSRLRPHVSLRKVMFADGLIDTP